MAVGHGRSEVGEGCRKSLVKQTEEKNRVSLVFISEVQFAYFIADWSRIQHRLGQSLISHGYHRGFSSLILTIMLELNGGDGGDVLVVTHHVRCEG